MIEKVIENKLHRLNRDLAYAKTKLGLNDSSKEIKSNFAQIIGIKLKIFKMEKALKEFNN